MILIVGLGNPGPQYQYTRHNIGFMVIDHMVNHESADLTSSKFLGNLYKKNNILFLKPNTFMNLSGNSVLMASNFYKPEKIIVIHDDMDLNFGALKFKFGGSSGGHNGIKSIDKMIGVDYFRVRIGISKSKFIPPVDYVLQNFNAKEREYLKDFIPQISQNIYFLIENGLEKTSSLKTIKGVQ